MMGLWKNDRRENFYDRCCGIYYFRVWLRVVVYEVIKKEMITGIIFSIIIIVGLIYIIWQCLNLNQLQYFLADDGVTIMKHYRKDYEIGNWSYVTKEVKFNTEKEYDKMYKIVKKKMEVQKEERRKKEELEKNRERWKEKHRNK